MATKLDKTLKREIEIDGQPYTVVLSAEGVKLTQKGYRKGSELTWREMLSAGGEGGGVTSGSTASGGMGGGMAGGMGGGMGGSSSGNTGASGMGGGQSGSSQSGQGSTGGSWPAGGMGR